MKKLIALLLLALSTASWAQGSKLDGMWLKLGLEAGERIKARQHVSDEDFAHSMEVIGFINGVVSAHVSNNLKASLIAAAISTARDSEGRKSFTSEEEAKVRTALVFSPLRRFPENVSRGQVLAVVSKYLAANPERWNQPAEMLVVAALAQAFKSE